MQQAFEKLGMFYLGRPWDLAAKKPGEGLLLYDSGDLVTHAVCIGMTGSGKTGLCLSLLEEAAIDGIPAIAIDPKGDLGNLLLTFPDLRGSDFLPWINEEDARRRGLSPEAFAQAQADLWRKGLAAWGQDGERIRRLRDSADFAIYTPGSDAGIPVSILSSFAAPPPAIRDDGDLLRERIAVTATGLLGLLGIEADPIRSREHILIATILGEAWKAGRDLDLAVLIHAIQEPPVRRIGVMELESFYPEKERFALAMSLNNLLAAPGFDAWLQGEPLDLGRILHTPEGKPRIAIFSIAHLGDAERMFFVSLLLNQTLGWVRAQSGTSSLRAILYMDEIAGYFPPVANPPSKAPLLTLMKQGRAFGLGVVLATQNPVDLDYKGLSNAGTWLIGRLQTERDKARVMDGLEGVAAGASQAFDRRTMEQTLAGLSSRVFLMNNVHEDAPVIFESRWAMSYLRGPLTRDQIRRLMAERPAGAAREAAGRRQGEKESRKAAAPAAGSSEGRRPVLPPDVPQGFLPLRGARPSGAALVYRPMALGVATVRFSDAKAGVDQEEEIRCLADLDPADGGVDWEKAAGTAPAAPDLEDEPEGDALFAALPASATSAKTYAAWKKAFADALFRVRTLTLWKSPGLGALSRPGESERDFRIRLGDLAREERDRVKEALRKKYAPRIAALEDRIRRARVKTAQEAEQAKQAKLQTAISLGTTLLGALFGRKAVSASTLGRATTAARGAARTAKESQDVARAEESAGALAREREQLEAELEAETARLSAAIDPLSERLEPIALRPKKANVSVRTVTLVWAPYWRRGEGDLTPAWE